MTNDKLLRCSTIGDKSFMRNSVFFKSTRKICIFAGGNAGLAAAYSARKLNVQCTVVVPSTTPKFMVQRLQEEGADVQICGMVG